MWHEGGVGNSIQGPPDNMEIGEGQDLSSNSVAVKQLILQN